VKDIKVLGTGCPKCEALAQNAQTAADQLGIEYDLEKVKDINQIMKFGVMSTPALVVDGTVVSTGKMLSPEQISDLLAD
jgi:small redox-active disulfide protein 2